MWLHENMRQETEGAKRFRYRAVSHWIWWACALLLLGPSLLVWVMRVVALFLSCAPGPGLCRGLAWGSGFRDLLDWAWFIGSHTRVLLAVALVAAIAALAIRRPLLAGLSLLVLPLSALVLPTLAVSSTIYAGCNANEAGGGDCALWGAKMGMSFHHAAFAPWQLYGVAPYCFALALMVAAIGFLFLRPPHAR